MFLIVGLGNPGISYTKNRHNVGFMAVDSISNCHNFLFTEKSKFKADIATGRLLGHKVILCKPLTYMNLSGESVQQIAHFYKIIPRNIIVIHDEIDIEFAKIKHKIGGGHAGHNGLRSLDKCLPNKEYQRIRIGIGRPEQDQMQVADYVLSDFTNDEMTAINQITNNISKNIIYLLEDKFDEFNFFYI